MVASRVLKYKSVLVYKLKFSACNRGCVQSALQDQRCNDA